MVFQTGKEGVKLSLCVGDTILYTVNPKEYTHTNTSTRANKQAIVH